MKIIPQIDTYPSVVGFCQTAPGKLAIVASFGTALALNRVDAWPSLTLIAGAATFLPAHRALMLGLGALYWLLFRHIWAQTDLIRQIAGAEGIRTDWILTLAAGGMLCGIFAGAAAFVRCTRTHRSLLISRRPVLVLLCGYFAALAAAGTLPLHGISRVLLWMFVALLAPYLWYFSYALTDATKPRVDFVSQFGYLRPFWMNSWTSFVPIGKGAAYLRKVEARTPKDLSVVQLKAVKLLMWVFVLKSLLWVFELVAHGESSPMLQRLFHLERLPSLGILRFDKAFEQLAAGTRLPILMAWGCSAANFVENVLGLYIAGNIAVACCRMAGFNALRNTYRPFRALTIADFWNRFYYYFKELLVEFFFFPCYTRYFKKHPRLRMFTATLAAATGGNLLYHFARDYTYVAKVGFWKAIEAFQVHTVYALFLGVAIGISQLRNRRLKPGAPLLRRLLASATVILFYGLVETFDPEDRAYPLSVHLTFIWNMFQF